MTKVLWDVVPESVKTELAARTDVRPNGIAIVEHVAREAGAAGEMLERHERWYFKRGPYGWLNLSVDREAAAPAVAPDLSPAQREEAKLQVAKVEELMRKHAESASEARAADALQQKLDVVTRSTAATAKLADSLRQKWCPATTDGQHHYYSTLGVPGRRCACGVHDPAYALGIMRSPDSPRFSTEISGNLLWAQQFKIGQTVSLATNGAPAGGVVGVIRGRITEVHLVPAYNRGTITVEADGS